MKVDEDNYQEKIEEIMERLDDIDKNNRENNIHYSQIENYLEKYHPLKV